VIFRDRAQRTAWLIALLALVCLGAAAYEQSFVHTDDGCQVEVHCLACRLALGGTAVGPAIQAPDVAPLRVVSRRPLSDRQRLPLAPAARSTASRAPPLA
jgi:hypothetical protein